MKPRHICYLSGTRADFGLMVSTLRLVNACPELSLSVLVTGMHLSPQYGLTVQEIESEGFRVMARVPCDMELTNGAQMARNIGVMLQGFVDVLQGRAA
jgi:GDP/UDP-N,N'-diacetylbacillosamine 2-epimerase (hydrolysing)